MEEYGKFVNPLEKDVEMKQNQRTTELPQGEEDKEKEEFPKELDSMDESKERGESSQREQEREKAEEKLPSIGESMEEKMNVGGIELAPESTLKEMRKLLLQASWLKSRLGTSSDRAGTPDDWRPFDLVIMARLGVSNRSAAMLVSPPHADGRPQLASPDRGGAAIAGAAAQTSTLPGTCPARPGTPQLLPARSGIAGGIAGLRFAASTVLGGVWHAPAQPTGDERIPLGWVVALTEAVIVRLHRQAHVFEQKVRRTRGPRLIVTLGVERRRAQMQSLYAKILRNLLLLKMNNPGKLKEEGTQPLGRLSLGRGKIGNLSSQLGNSKMLAATAAEAPMMGAAPDLATTPQMLRGGRALRGMVTGAGTSPGIMRRQDKEVGGGSGTGPREPVIYMDHDRYDGTVMGWWLHLYNREYHRPRELITYMDHVRPPTTWTSGPPAERSWTTSSNGGGGGMGGTKGPSERLIVPSFSGGTENGGDLGSSARSYLRQVSVWEKMTKLAPDQRALVLYQHLAGSAWVNSESLSVDELASPDGVNRLREWVRKHYLDVEVTQVGRSLSDLFRKLRRRPTQSFRDYAAEFNRLLARVVECGCALPDVANAWLFVDRANLDEATEVSLLASVGNKYALRALQSAAIVLDRSMRKPWEKAGVRPRTQNVNHAEGIDETNASDSEIEAPTYDDPDADAGDLYVSYMTAKARYKEATKARGVETKFGDKEKEGETNHVRRAAENKIALAKAKSHCSACGQKGHWHRDEVCPKFGKGQSAARTQTIHVTNEVYELLFGGAGELMAILDTACSKTVVGTNWFQKYLNHTKGGGYDAELVHERESFKFGAASKIYESTYAAVIYIPIASQVVAVKASVIHGDVPLLMSKPALTRLGLILDLSRNVATFRIEIVSHREVYTIGCTGDGMDRIVSKVTIRLYGLAAVSSTEPKHPLFRDLPAMVAVWQMTKGQLIAECNRRELAISPEWTCPELRTILMADMDYEKQNTTGAVPKKLSGMNLAELREEATKMNLSVHDKESKGTLMLRIRDAAAPSTTVMTVGRFRGTLFSEVPESYGAWASEEERQNGDNMHTDLKRFVNWRRHMRAQPKASMTPPRSAASYLGVETYASVQPPPMSETGSSSWAAVESVWSGYSELHGWRPVLPQNLVPEMAAAKAKRQASRARPPPGEEPARMEQEIAEETLMEIHALETRLEIDEKRPSGAHVTHYEQDEGFQSCSSGSEDLVKDAYYVSRRQGIHGLPEDGGRATFGYYAYGTFKGITKRTLQWPHLTAYLNRVITEYVGGDGPEQREPTWSSIALLHNCPAAMHTDKNNVKGSHNFVVSFGQGEGGDMWVQESGGGAWRRDAKGHEVEGRIVSTHEQGWEFDPRLRHCTETFHGERWFIAGFTARTYPDSNKEEKKLLRELGFPLPSKSQLRCDRRQEEVVAKADEPSAECPPSSSTRPRKSCRRNIRKTALLLSVLLTTVLSTMAEAAQLALLPRPAPSTPLLEVGGISATCRLAEYGICGDHLVEPIVVEDVLHNDRPADCDIGYLEAAVMKHEPGQLWVHVKEEFGDGAVYNDLVEAVSYQLGAGRSVVFEKEIDEPRLWHDMVTAESAGYSVRHDHTANGNESIHVIYDEQESYVNTVYAGEAEDGRVAPHRVGDEGEEDQPMARGAQAIRFPPSVPSTVAASLRRLHQNLGHPSVADFVRHLRLAGASREVLKAARNLECQVCQRTRRPAIAKPAKVASCFRFNEMIGTDLFYIHDSEGQRHQLLSIVDFSSAYHVVVPVARKDTPTLERAFCENWINIFGAPSVVAVDMENGLEKSLGRISDWTGTRVRTAAGQAHHQAGYTERQGAIWKEIFQRVCEEQSVVKSDIHLAICAVSSAKNQLTKTSGFSPCQHVFGTSPVVPEDLLDGPHALQPGDEPIIDDRHAREVALRTAARAAYFHVQTDERVRRALAGRARVEARTPETGERVFYYRKTKNNKKGTWVGPGTIIGQEGANLWVTRGGRCVLCAPEHVRLATAEELGQAFSLHVAQQDLDKLLNADSEQDDMFIDGEEENADDEPRDEADEGYGIGEIAMDIEEDSGDRRGVRRELARVPPMVLKRQRRKGRGDEAPAGPGPHEAHMLKKARTPRSKEKQLEKEIPWAMIPEEMRPAFRSAEAVQWKEHVDTGALEVLDLATSDRIRQTVAAERWSAAAGDVQLARIRKGVFGLSESPRMWYDRLSSVLLGEVFEVEGKSGRLIPSPLDPCVLMLLEGGLPGEPLAYICIHVDDLLLVAPREVNRKMQKRISELFPVDSWLEDSFEYTGSFIEVGSEGITINQASFVDGRLFTVDIPRGQNGAEPASTEQAIDNRSLIGALSWLSSQSRPDLLCGVTLSQQLQRAPLTEDVRFVNQLKARAEEHRGEGIYLHGIFLDSAMFLVYHDAAWANAELEDVE
ncbi:GIP, partial [Symbiodinium sp. CCMP2456]